MLAVCGGIHIASCWWFGCTCDIRRFASLNKCTYTMSLLDCDRASRRKPVGGGGGVGTGRVYVPGRGMKHDDPHPALLLASRSLAAGASACTPCGTGSYYGSTGVHAFVCACSCDHASRILISPIRLKNRGYNFKKKIVISEGIAFWIIMFG